MSRLLLLALLFVAHTALAAERPAEADPVPVVGVRGLDKSAPAPDTADRDYAAIDHLESITMEDSELKAFLKEGGLK